MYIIEDFVDMGLEEGQEWTTPFHREVAVLCLIQNPRVFTKKKLMDNVKVINSLDNGYLQSASIDDLLDKGCNFVIK